MITIYKYITKSCFWVYLCIIASIYKKNYIKNNFAIVDLLMSIADEACEDTGLRLFLKVYSDRNLFFHVVREQTDVNTNV